MQRNAASGLFTKSSGLALWCVIIPNRCRFACRSDECIYLIASKEPNAELEGLYRTLQTARQQRNMQQANAVQEKLSKHFKRRGVDEIVTDRKIGVRWEESEDVFSVINTRLENLCKDCVHVVEFVHE